jgi:tetratricopeptide (TPR) repeat protein
MRALFFLLTMLALLIPAANAGQKKRTQSAQDEARDLYKQGMTHYELGEFNLAIDEFKRAYALTSAPGLLFNLAQVYRMKKDPEQAVYFYRTYLRLVPDAPNRADVEALLAENQALLDADRAKKRAAAEVAAAAAAAAPPAAPPSVAATTPERSPSPPPRRRPWRRELWIGVGAGALGIAALATAAALGARSSSDASQISSANAQHDVPWDASKQALWRDGQNSADASTALYVAGGVVAAAGVALVAIGLHDRARSRSFAVVPSTTGASVVMSCAF